MTTSDLATVQVGAGEGRPMRFFGEVVTRKVASEQTGGAFTLSEAVVRSGRSVPPHIHHREDECFYILDGTFEFSIAGASHRSGAGSLLYVAKGTLHAYENVGRNAGKLLVWQTPGGLCERFYEEVGEEASSEDVPMADSDLLEATRVAKIAAGYGIEIIVRHPGQ